MPVFTIIDASGSPQRVVSVPSTEAAAAQLGSGEAAVLGSAPPDTYWHNQQWVSRPPRPTPYHAWIASTWTDQRTPQAIRRAKEDAARKQRDRLLAETDWIALRALDDSAPVPPAWTAYRRALRNLPAQPGFPNNIVWPERPQGE